MLLEPRENDPPGENPEIVGYCQSWILVNLYWAVWLRWSETLVESAGAMGNSIFASLAFMSPLEILYEWVRGRVLLDDDVTDLISLPQFIPIIEMKSMGTLYFLNFYDTESNFLNFNFFSFYQKEQPKWITIVVISGK